MWKGEVVSKQTKRERRVLVTIKERTRARDDQDNDKAFREGVALFLSDTGHGDWAMNIPGIDLDSVLNTFRVSSI